MSSAGPSAWQRTWIAASARARRRLLWRGVEAQHIVATLRLADSAADQKVLEELLEASKPPLPAGGRHYLLATPFRYRAPVASRFRRAHDAGAWYGAEELRTACAEVGYWRWRFLMDSAGLEPGELLTTHTFFRAQAHGRCLDLTREPWLASRALWRDPRDYSHCHALAAAARAAGIAWIRYASARVERGMCGAVFTPGALTLASGQQTWACRVTRSGARLQRSGLETAAGGESHEFSAAQWG
jgi:hypothetical protein